VKRLNQSSNKIPKTRIQKSDGNMYY
jgi:hypothetical protein